MSGSKGMQGKVWCRVVCSLSVKYWTFGVQVPRVKVSRLIIYLISLASMSVFCEYS